MDSTETVIERTCEEVYQRDGSKCWLCNRLDPIQITYHINEEALDTFSMCTDNGTIPSFVDSLEHPDNLFPLCYNCQARYDKVFPDWLLIPDEVTLRKYIEHEKLDFEKRLVSQKFRYGPLPRSLPLITRSEILYHPLIITQPFTKSLSYYGRVAWPKCWLGEPTMTIHRAARCGLFESNPIRPIRLRHNSHITKWQTGVPEVFQLLVGELTRLWARKLPKRLKV